jgi:hypothetical protein
MSSDTFLALKILGYRGWQFASYSRNKKETFTKEHGRLGPTWIFLYMYYFWMA